jgi:hypothetical protein
VDGGRGDRRVTGRNRELMEIADNVPGGVEAINCRLLEVVTTTFEIFNGVVL